MEAPIRHYVNQTPSAYAMDNWHVTPRLSACNSACGTMPCRMRGSGATRFQTSIRSSIYFGRSRSGMLTDRWIPRVPASSVLAGFAYYLNGIGSRESMDSRAAWSPTTTTPCNRAVGFSEDLFGTARPFFAAASERSSSACRATTSTTPPRRRRSLTTRAPDNVYFSTPTKSWVTGDCVAIAVLPAGIN